MAGSDKNAYRSVTGGNPTQPSQPLSKAESGAVAGQKPEPLKTPEVPAPSSHHEARLGIMVITILVFALGFLVYNKVDQHQRRLTQAAITSGAESTKSGPSTIANALLANSAAPSSAADPLFNRADLSDGSPFTDQQTTKPANSERRSTTGNAISATTTSGGADSATPEFSFTEPSEPLPSKSLQVDGRDEMSSSTEDLAEDVQYFPAGPATHLTDSARPATSAPDGKLGSSRNSADSDVPVLEVFDSAGSTVRNDPPAIDNTSTLTDDDAIRSDEETLQSSSTVMEDVSPQQNERTIEFAQSEPDSAADSEDASTTNSAEQFLQADSDDSVPTLVATSPAATAGNSEIHVPAETESSISFLAPEALADSSADSTSNDAGNLLAMADPPKDSGFSGGFTAEDNSVSIGRAPVGEPADTFPAFDTTDQSPKPTIQKESAPAVERSTSIASQGFNAVTRPGNRSAKNSIRTAAGSGSDGKFSLAAFNYQNQAAEPAPDDGSTFDSIVVQDGDNYTKISKRVYGTVQYFSALAVFNQHRIREPKSMRPGMVVLTPPKEILEERYPQLFIDSQPKTAEPAEFLMLDDGSPAYRVGERETLSEISERFLGRSARWIEIYRLNQTVVKDPNKLKAGLILALPADAAEVIVVP